MQALSEECTISNLEKLGNEIASGTINKGDTKVTLVSDEFITAYSTSNKVYYYIILEYPNLDTPQNEDINGILNGKISAEENKTKPDINIIAAYIKEDNGEYKQVDDIPQNGYTINTSKSTCSNGAVPSWKDNGLFVSSLTKSGTSCYLYFDVKQPTASETILANLGSNIKTDTPDFSVIADTDEGVYATSDGMYGNTTDYWRGKVENNYVKFGGFCWRIIRINGDKSIRMIYDGHTCHVNGTSTDDSIAVTNQAYNSTYNASYYVGWTQKGTQRTNSTSATASNAKIESESWYNTNIGNNSTYAAKVADGKFCNDRNVDAAPSIWGSGYATSWSATGTSFAYASTKRLYESYSPTFNCNNAGDVYTLKVGLITADEVEFAGGKNENNTSYYLCNGQSYWTMSPYTWSSGDAQQFLVNSSGYLNGREVVLDLNLRPVINLKSDVTFSSGNGTLEQPYVVS